MHNFLWSSSTRNESAFALASSKKLKSERCRKEALLRQHSCASVRIHTESAVQRTPAGVYLFTFSINLVARHKGACLFWGTRGRGIRPNGMR